MTDPERESPMRPEAGAGGGALVKVCLECRSTFRTRRDTCPNDGSPLIERDLPRGAILAGKYRIREKIGHGGMGVVYRAEHIIMGKTVAIKVINPLFSTEEKFLDMFKAEARMAATFKHPNALTVHDFGQARDRFYLVMELLEGRSLRTILDERKSLPAEKAFAILKKVCDAVSAAHEAGIIHLDLKGENVYVNETPEGDTVKVLDFGLARLVGSATAHVDDEMTIGTVGYMAPEQIMGYEVDLRTDVYAIGVMAFETLTGQLPFPGDTKDEILQSQIHGKTIKWPKSKVLKVVPKEAKSSILAAIEMSPTKRPESVKTLGAIFGRALESIRTAARTFAQSHGLAPHLGEKTGGSFLRKVRSAVPIGHRDRRGPTPPEGMVYVPRGEFLMGSNLGNMDERPATKTPLDAFFIDVVCVTNLDYAKFVQETDHGPPATWKTVSFPPGRGDLPVTGISWQDAVDYVEWAKKRLPTESEWEKAARGADGRVYPWGNKWDATIANWGGNPRFYGGAVINSVGSFPYDKSPYGCLDMAGNVKEWTASWYKPYGPSEFKTDDFGEIYRVARGGSHLSIDKGYLRCSYRSHANPDERSDIGFRCAVDVRR